jgi:S1-C subfamily serine protease
MAELPLPEEKPNEQSASQAALWRKRWQRLRAWARSAAPFAAPFAAGVLATFLALLFFNTLAPAPQPLTSQEVGESVATALAEATLPPALSARAYQLIRPSLVLIETKAAAEDGEADSGLGSGVVVDASGAILTSLHVVADASEIIVTFADGTQSSAEVAVAQPENDIAVLLAHQPPAQLFPAILGNPGALRVGDETFAVGNPFGLYGSMSAGVISGFDRTFRPPNGDQQIQGLIQIDAAVNPGNSGGPLLNRFGQVVGIVVGIANPTEQNVFIGIGFAVPINVAGAAAGLPPY